MQRGHEHKTVCPACGGSMVPGSRVQVNFKCEGAKVKYRRRNPAEGRWELVDGIGCKAKATTICRRCAEKLAALAEVQIPELAKKEPR